MKKFAVFLLFFVILASVAWGETVTFSLNAYNQNWDNPAIWVVSPVQTPPRAPGTDPLADDIVIINTAVWGLNIPSGTYNLKELRINANNTQITGNATLVIEDFTCLGTSFWFEGPHVTVNGTTELHELITVTNGSYLYMNGDLIEVNNGGINSPINNRTFLNGEEYNSGWDPNVPYDHNITSTNSGKTINGGNVIINIIDNNVSVGNINTTGSVTVNLGNNTANFSTINAGSLIINGTGNFRITQDITTTGNQAYTTNNTGTVTVVGNRTLKSTSGTITTSVPFTATDGVIIDAANGVTIGTGGISADTTTGVVRIVSGQNINVNNNITAKQLITYAASGSVNFNNGSSINVSHTGVEGEDAAISVYAASFNIGNTATPVIMGTNGQLCLILENDLTVANVTNLVNIVGSEDTGSGGFWHRHSLMPPSDPTHLVYTTSLSFSDTFIDSSGVTINPVDYHVLTVGSDTVFNVQVDKNIYIIDVEDPKALTFITTGTGFIEIRGDVKASSLTLNSANGIRLVNADFNLTGASSSFNTSNTTLILIGNNEIQAGNITIGNNVVSTGSGNLKLNGASITTGTANINVTNDIELTATDNITIGSGGITASGSTTGKMIFNSGENITINGNLSGERLIAIATTGTVAFGIGRSVNMSSDGTGDHHGSASIYIDAASFVATGSMGTITPGSIGTGKLCICQTTNRNVNNNRIAEDRICVPDDNDKHLIFGRGINIGEFPGVADDYLIIDLDVYSGTIESLYTVNSDKNIYLVNVTTFSNPITFTVDGPVAAGFIEIRGNYSPAGVVTLNPGSGGIQLNNAAIDITGAFAVNNSNNNFSLIGTNNTITASNITLGAVNGTGNFTLNGTNITLNGIVDVTGIMTVNNSGLFTQSTAITANGGINFNGDVTVVGTTLTTTNNNIVFNNAVTGTGNLTLAAGTGTISLNGNINISGDLIFTGAVTLGGTGTRELISTGGSISIGTGLITATTGIFINADDNILIGAGGIGAGANPIVLVSDNDDININGAISALNLDIRAVNGDVVLTGAGNIQVSNTIITTEPCPEDLPNVVIYINAKDFDIDSYSGFITPGSTGQLCLDLDTPYAAGSFNSVVTGGSANYHIHNLIAEKHIVYYSSAVYLTITDLIAVHDDFDESTHEFIDRITNPARTSFIAPLDKNIYIVDIGDTDLVFVFTTSGTGYVEFRGYTRFTASQTGGGSISNTNGIHLNNASIRYNNDLAGGVTNRIILKGIEQPSGPYPHSTITANNLTIGRVEGLYSNDLTLVTIGANTDVSIAGPIDVSAIRDLTITTRNVNQSGAIISENLIINATGAINLNNAGNSIDLLKITGFAGASLFRNSKDLIIDGISGFNGGTAAARGITITAIGEISQSDSIINAQTGTVTLNATGGITLNDPANNIATVSLTNNTSGNISYVNNRTTAAGLTATAVNNATTGGEISITNSGNLIVGAAGIQANGSVNLESGANTTINGSINSYDLTIESDGNVIVSSTFSINTTSNGDCIEDPVDGVSIHVKATNFTATGTGLIVPGTMGQLCLILGGTHTIDAARITATRYHVHYNDHIVYGNGPDLGNIPDGNGGTLGTLGNEYSYIDSSLGNLQTVYVSRPDKNIYIIDVGYSNAEANARYPTFTVGTGANRTGRIEIRGDYTSTNITLNPGSGGVVLENADIILSSPTSSFNPNGELILRGTGSVNNINANIITLDNNVEGNGNNLTLEADTVNISGTMGTTSSRLGNFTVDGVITGTSLTVNANNGISLESANNVASVSLSNVSTGDIKYNSNLGTTNTLTVNINNNATNGNIIITETGNVVIEGGGSISVNALNTGSDNLGGITCVEDSTIYIKANDFLPAVSNSINPGLGHLCLDLEQEYADGSFDFYVNGAYHIHNQPRHIVYYSGTEADLIFNHPDFNFPNTHRLINSGSNPQTNLTALGGRNVYIVDVAFPNVPVTINTNGALAYIEFRGNVSFTAVPVIAATNVLQLRNGNVSFPTGFTLNNLIELVGIGTDNNIEIPSVTFTNNITGNGNNLTITTTSGGVAVNTANSITGVNTLTINSIGSIDLSNAGNVINILNITGAGGAVEFTNTGALTIAGINNVGSNNITIENTGIVDQSGAIVTTGILSVTATGGITLDSIANNTANITFFNNTSGDIIYENNGSLTIGDVTNNNGEIELKSVNNQNININGDVTGTIIILKAGTKNGDVIINTTGTLTSTGTGRTNLGGSSLNVACDISSTIYIGAKDFSISSANINPSAATHLCLDLDTVYTDHYFHGFVAGDRYHLHNSFNGNSNLVYYDGTMYTLAQIQIIYGVPNFHYIDASISNDTTIFVNEGFNIFIHEIGSINKQMTFRIQGTPITGQIHFIGDYTSSELALFPSDQGVYLNNANIELDGATSSFNVNQVTLNGANAAFGSTIEANSITIGTIVGGNNSLTLTSSAVNADAIDLTTADNLRNLTVDGNSTIRGNIETVGTIQSTTDAQVYNGAVILSASGGTVNLSAAAGSNIHFQNTINGANALVVNGGNVIFDDEVGGSTRLTSININNGAAGTTTINNDIKTTGDQIYGANTGSGLITLIGDIEFSTINDAVVRFNGNVSGDGDLTVADAVPNTTTTIITGNVETAGDQTYNGPVRIGGSVNLTANTGTTITFNRAGSTDTVESIDATARSLTITDANAIFNGNVGTIAGTGNPIASVSVTGGGSSNINADISTTGNQSYGIVTLGASGGTVELSATNAGSNIHFQNTVNGANALVVNGGNVIFDDEVGGSTRLTSININNGAAGTTTINNDIKTTGDQIYGANTGSGLITLIGDIEFSTINDAVVRFNGNVSGDGSLTVANNASNTTTTIITGNVVTVDDQVYNGPVRIGGTVNLTANTGTTITFNRAGLTDTVESIDATAHALTITNANVTFNGDVGVTGTGIGNLSSVTVNGGITTVRGDITTTLTQSYGLIELGGGTPASTRTLQAGGIITLGNNIEGNDRNLTLDGAVTLTGDIEFNGNAGRDLVFSNTVNGAFGLTVTDANVQFNNIVGSAPATRLTFINVTSGNTTVTAVDAANSFVNTTGNQDYGGQLILGGFVRTFFSTSGYINVVGSVSGTAGITATASNRITMDNANNTLGGSVIFNNTTLGDITFRTDANITLDAVNTAPDSSIIINQAGTLEITRLQTPVVAASGSIILGESTTVSVGVLTQTGAILTRNLEINSSGSITLNLPDTTVPANNVRQLTVTNAVGNIGFINTGNLIINGIISTSATVQNVTISTTGAITVSDIITATGTVNLTSTGGAITIDDGITAGGAATLRSGDNQNITINAPVNTLSLALISGSNTLPDTLTTGVVTITNNAVINVSSTNAAAHDENAAVYIWAGSLTGSGNIDLTGNGWVCAHLINNSTYTGNVTNNRIHYHARADRHIIYSYGNDPGFGSHGIAANTYLYLRADLDFGNLMEIKSSGSGNIYIIDINNTGSLANNRSIIFENGTDGFIEFRRNYFTTETLTLLPGSGGVRFDNVNIELPNDSFDIANTNNNITLLNANQANTINAAGIELGGTVNGDNHLTLDTATGFAASNTNTIAVTGPVGNSTTRLRNITVNSNNPANGANTFTGAVWAASFTQTGTGSTTFNGQQDYTGNFNFTGTGLLISGGIITIGGNLDFVGSTITVNDEMTVNGNTNMNNLAAFSLDANATFRGNYTTAAAATGALTGTTPVEISFGGLNVVLGNYSHQDSSTMIFYTGASALHNLTYIPSVTDTNLSNVRIVMGNTVIVPTGFHITQRNSRNLILESDQSTTPSIAGAVLNLSAGTWQMGAGAVQPNSFTGLNGNLILGGTPERADRRTLGSRIVTNNFHLNGGSPTAFTVENTDWVTIDVLRTDTLPNVVNIANTANLTLTGDTPMLVIEMRGNGAQSLTINQPIGSLHVGNQSRTTLNSVGTVTFRGEVIILSNNPNISWLDAGDNDIVMRAGLKGTRNFSSFNNNGTDEIRYTRWENSGNVVINPMFPDMNMNYVFRQNTTKSVSFQTDGSTSLPVFFEIVGFTVWRRFICEVPGAVIQFSRDPHQHVILEKFIITGSSTDYITLTRLTEGTFGIYPYIYDNSMGTPPAVNVLGTFALPAVPPPGFDLKEAGNVVERSKYWNINLIYTDTNDPLDEFNNINNINLYFSHSYNQRIRVPILKTNLNFDPFYEPGQDSYFNYWWIWFRVPRTILYSFTENYTGDGRLDRIRVQTNFHLNGIFTGFDVSVEGYEIDRNMGVNGFQMVYDYTNEGSFDDDSFYIYLIPKPYIDDGNTPRWSVTRNTSLRNTHPPYNYVGEPAVDRNIKPFDTIPPRILYTLTLPGHPQIYVRTSKPVVAQGFEYGSNPVIPTSVETTNQYNYTWTYHPIIGNPDDYTELINSATLGYILNLPPADSLDVSDLAGLSIDSSSLDPGYFRIDNMVDQARRALDWNTIDQNNNYNAPKYPLNWGYTRYAIVYGNSHLIDDYPLLAPDSSVVSNDNTEVLTVHDVFMPPNRLLTPEMMRELVTTNGSTVTPHSFDNNTYHNNTPVKSVIRRVTDVLISIPPSNANSADYFVWPVWARHKTLLNTDPFNTNNADFWGTMITDTGVIWDFDGTKYLEFEYLQERGDIELQARVHSSLSGSYELFWTSDIPVNFRNPALSGERRRYTGGLWIPGIDFLNVNYFMYYYSQIYTGNAINHLSNGTNVGSSLFNYDLSGITPSGNKIEFIFRLDPASDLFVARLDIAQGAAIPGNWYQLLRPFGFDVQDITRQRGGVTILNNVINSDNREVAYVRYHLVRPGRVTINVHTLDGTLVKSLRRNEQRDAGEYTDGWDGTNNAGRPVARGMYFIRVVGPDIDEIRKVMVVR